MREILFRGRISKNEWVYGLPIEGEPLIGRGKETCIVTKPGLSYYDGVLMTYDECVEVDPDTVGQFAGLTDRNGVKIFEGDIVRWHDNTELSVGGQIAEVCFGKYRDADSVFDDIFPLGFYIRFSDKNCITISWLDEYKNYFDIIGNIHDTPELLEVSGDEP